MTPTEPGHDGTIPALQIWDPMGYHSPPAPLLPCSGDSSPSAITGTSSPCQAAHFRASLVYSALNVHIPGASQLHNHQNQHGAGAVLCFCACPVAQEDQSLGSGRSQPRRPCLAVQFPPCWGGTRPCWGRWEHPESLQQCCRSGAGCPLEHEVFPKLPETHHS